MCGHGAVGIRMCAGSAHAVALCDECDAVWQTPDLSMPPLVLSQPKLPCPQCGQSLIDPTAHWATWAEVERIGWQDAVVGQGPALRDDTAGDNDQTLR